MSEPAIERAIEVARTVRRQIRREQRDGKHAYVEDRMRGACGLAAARICMELGTPEPMRKGEFLCRCTECATLCGTRRLAEGEGYYESHCWIEIGGIIIDPTATQFGRFHSVAVIRPGTVTHARYKTLVEGADALESMLWWLEQPDYWHVEQFVREYRDRNQEARAS